jgi:hypothetical protein
MFELGRITNILLEDHIDYTAIRDACMALRNIFFEATGFDESLPETQAHISTEAGLAVGPLSAAFCITDMLRTRVFLRGLFEAIKDRLTINPSKPVTVLYAGTGPFATLLVPLTTRFTPQQLQMVLLEINPVSIIHLRKTIEYFHIEPYIALLEEADAVQYIIPQTCQPDILLSETMKPALLREPQVSIVANLATQRVDAILIPECIRIEAAFMPQLSHPNFSVHPLCVLLELTSETGRQLKDGTIKQPVFSDGVVVEITALPDSSFTRLSLLTHLHIYKEHIVQFNESSLTIPQPVMRTDEITHWPASFHFQYLFSPEPHFLVAQL